MGLAQPGERSFKGWSRRVVSGLEHQAEGAGGITDGKSIPTTDNSVHVSFWADSVLSGL